MEEIVSTIQFEAKMLSNYFSQLYIEPSNILHHDFSAAVICNQQELVTEYFAKFCESLIPDESSSLFLHSACSLVPVSKEVQEDLMKYFTFGSEAYINYVKAAILKKSSITKTAIRRSKLRTFTPKRITKTQLKQMAKEKKLVMTCHQRAIAALKMLGA